MNVYPIDDLDKCRDLESIDNVFSGMQGAEDLETRIMILHMHMGITQHFTCSGDKDGPTLEQEYSCAKQQLIIINENKNSA